MPGRKPTDAEIEERTNTVRGLLAKALPMGQIKRALRLKYGDVCARTCDRYVSRAKEQMLKDSKRPREEWIAHHIEIYYGFLREKNASTSAKVAAIARIDCLLGLESSRRVEVSGHDGGPVQLQSLLTAAALAPAECEQAFAEANHNGHVDGIITAGLDDPRPAG